MSLFGYCAPTFDSILISTHLSPTLATWTDHVYRNRNTVTVGYKKFILLVIGDPMPRE